MHVRSRASTLFVRSVDCKGEADASKENPEKKSSESSDEKTLSSQTSALRREVFQVKIENEAKPVQVARLEVSSIHTNNIVAESYSFCFLLFSYVELGTILVLLSEQCCFGE